MSAVVHLPTPGTAYAHIPLCGAKEKARAGAQRHEVTCPRCDALCGSRRCVCLDCSAAREAAIQAARAARRDPASRTRAAS